MRNDLQLSPTAEDTAHQFRLVRMQTFNWGTFSGVFSFSIAEKGYLFVGPSGSGKSTILDAHASLTTPSKWLEFNVAAREAERASKDRSSMTYVRGAYGQQTGETGEHVAQYLRKDSTWSAIAETYRDGTGRLVVLAQVLWVKGKTTTSTDVHRHYLILEREFDVRELEFFPKSDFDVRRFKHDLPDAFARSEFGAYQERFRTLLGIDNERALRLLHKTQSAKNLGDLNAFLRDFMLDPPETFGVANKLVEQFTELSEAHRAVVSAREQRDMLLPAQADEQELEKVKADKNQLNELSSGIDRYRAQRRKGLLEKQITNLADTIAGMGQEAKRLEKLANVELATLWSLRDQRSGLGGNVLEQLKTSLTQAEAQRDARMEKRAQAKAALTGMGWPEPSNAVEFAAVAGRARTFLADAIAQGETLDDKKFKLRTELGDKETRFKEYVAEVNAMKRQPSNIPSAMLTVRKDIAHALGLTEEKLPFAGELIQVKPEAVPWQGAIERVLNSFAQSLLVDEKHYAAVAAYINSHFLGTRLVYFRTAQHAAVHRSVGPDSLFSKLEFARTPFTEWVRSELKAGFDYECVDDVQAFRSATRALTKEGQVKHSATRHEKNDRVRVDDRSRWVLGFDNTAKRKLYEDKAAELGAEIAQLHLDIRQANEDGRQQQAQTLYCNTLSNMTWEEVDVMSMLAHISAKQQQIQAEQAARPELAEIDQRIEKQEQVQNDAARIHTVFLGEVEAAKKQLEGFKTKLHDLPTELISVALTPFQQAQLDGRYAQTGKEATLDNLDYVTNQVERALSKEVGLLQERIQALQNSIERRFADFIRKWPAEASGLDATMASASDFFAKLERIVKDGLPAYEARFLQLLREQSDQSLTRLSTQLDQERKAIRDRMDIVNESLRTAPFNPGTHLDIQTIEKLNEDVRTFKQNLKDALSHSLGSNAEVEKEFAEKRFEVINALVKRFSSQETADRNWRSLVLDVRQHVEFVAKELDNEDGREIEVYRSGAGKSGGQRQKLAATCLAAALRYQLAGRDRALPRFSTVVLDEAFDKADAEFTTMAMNIFKTFGFQMIVATPLKSVMTLEPFIGGACFILIKERNTSSAIPIDYDEATQRLKLKDEAQDVEEATAA